MRNGYFDWLCELVDLNRYNEDVSYHKLLEHLHKIEFTWIIPKDANRANDGTKLRWKYYLRFHETPDESAPCSVLEMMVALAFRCETTIMDDPELGDRTGQWFWGMIHNLGLTSMRDYNFDPDYVDEVIARLLNREYKRDGTGGLFRVKNCKSDMRKVEIWCQLSWYLNTFI